MATRLQNQGPYRSPGVHAPRPAPPSIDVASVFILGSVWAVSEVLLAGDLVTLGVILGTLVLMVTDPISNAVGSHPGHLDAAGRDRSPEWTTSSAR